MKLEQLYKLPDVGQLSVCCALSLLVHGGVAGEEEEQEWGRGGRRREGVKDTWVSKCAVELDICKSISGGEVQTGITTQRPH